MPAAPIAAWNTRAADANEPRNDGARTVKRARISQPGIDRSAVPTRRAIATGPKTVSSASSAANTFAAAAFASRAARRRIGS